MSSRTERRQADLDGDGLGELRVLGYTELWGRESAPDSGVAVSPDGSLWRDGALVGTVVSITHSFAHLIRYRPREVPLGHGLMIGAGAAKALRDADRVPGGRVPCAGRG
jgi:hypothetical protein